MLNCPLFLGAVAGLFRSDMLLIFTMVWPSLQADSLVWMGSRASRYPNKWVCSQSRFGHDFLRDRFYLSAVSLSRLQHDFLDFSYCPLSRVLHVTLANWQRFKFEFHLRSSPSAFSGCMDISRPADYFITCYTVLTRPNKFENSCPRLQFSWLSVWTLSCRCPVKLCISLASLFAILSKATSYFCSEWMNFSVI